ncbi:P-loop containing nucleoside triphosphate hydrolase protein [Salix suchowensis]|nr:P-loop containing nucleoside triphosphate hydrolase protein [Salix suchowensis]
MMRKRLRPGNQQRLVYFHSTMTPAYREEKVRCFREGSVVGLFATDAFGMVSFENLTVVRIDSLRHQGMDLADIAVIVQFKSTCDLNSLFQRFGRAARGCDQSAVAILLVDKKDTDESRMKSQRAAQKRKEKKLKGTVSLGKRKEEDSAASERPIKRVALTDVDGNIRGVRTDTAVVNDDIYPPMRVMKKMARIIECDRPVAKELKSRRVEVGSAMDDYINSGERGIKCQRIVPTLFFGNDRRRKFAKLIMIGK